MQGLFSPFFFKHKKFYGRLLNFSYVKTDLTRLRRLLGRNLNFSTVKTCLGPCPGFFFPGPPRWEIKKKTIAGKKSLALARS